MSRHAPLLVELLTEELPPRALKRLGEVFAGRVFQALGAEALLELGARLEWYATPRRLAAVVGAVREQAPDREVERKIMPVAVAFDSSGAPTAALLRKLAALGIAPDRASGFERRVEGKSEMLFHRDLAGGATLAQRIEAVIDGALKGLPIPKVMRWGDGSEEFVRPVHGLIVLHGERILDCEVLGARSGDRTRGHRFMGARDVRIPEAGAYEQVLECEGRVIASFGRRRAAVRAMLEACAAREGARLRYADELLDEVTALVEYPAVYAGRFDEEFLQVPQECLILTMQQNQKYFPLFDSADRLCNRFLIVSNIAPEDPRHIVQGNERVVRPRLADARFFFDQDRKVRLASRVERLAQVVFHNKLGTQLARVERLRLGAGSIARRLGGDPLAAERAAWLAKADLVTRMVGEFPDLQGVMGRHYALHDGEEALVADAIAGHYYPRHAGDSLPVGNTAAAVALADRLDTLVGMFGIGAVPTGDRDPFGLRRAALGVLRILIETPLPLDLGELLADAAGAYPPGVLDEGHTALLLDFLFERLRNHLREAGHPHEAVEAVLAGRPMRIDLVLPRLEAVREFLGLPEAAALAAANKRIVNILKKSEAAPAEPDVLLLQEASERRLFHQMNEIAPVVRSLVAGEDYTAALTRLAGLRESVDAFFDEVMVMVEEPLTRRNRLAMLKQLAGLMNQVADISRLSA
jgi:glycyl-tRNA synthetase beta chain